MFKNDSKLWNREKFQLNCIEGYGIERSQSTEPMPIPIAQLQL